MFFWGLWLGTCLPTFEVYKAPVAHLIEQSTSIQVKIRILIQIMRFFLFGEDTTDLHSHLRTQLIESRGQALLEQLFQRTANTLRHEIASLSAIDRHVLPAFSTLNELNDRSEQGINHAGVENALLFISSIASYIR